MELLKLRRNSDSRRRSNDRRGRENMQLLRHTSDECKNNQIFTKKTEQCQNEETEKKKKRVVFPKLFVYEFRISEITKGFSSVPFFFPRVRFLFGNFFERLMLKKSVREV